MRAVTLDHVSVTFNRWGADLLALRSVSLTLEVNAWVLLTGHNGSGKSTLLRVLRGFVEPTSGSVGYGDPPIHLRNSTLAREVVLIAQDPSANTAGMLTVAENLAIADPGARTPGARRRVYENALSPYGLERHLAHLASSLSGGERQILALIMALRHPAPIVLLDEPFAAMDITNVSHAQRALGDLHAAGKTIMQVTHELGIAARTGTRTVVLRDGTVVHDTSGPCRSEEDIKAAIL